MLIDFIAGDKLDFYKISPLIEAVQAQQSKGVNIGYRIIYTGKQEGFDKINKEFSLLNIPSPTTFLAVNNSSDSAEYIATCMVRYDKVLKTGIPDITIVIGHSTGAMACTIAASKLKRIKIAHIEAGLRNYSRKSSDETNRKLIDSVSDYYFSIAQASSENLRNEGVKDDHIFFVGNLIADFLFTEIDNIPQPSIWKKLQLEERNYLVLKVEHSHIINDPQRLKSVLLNTIRVSKNIPILVLTNEQSFKAIKSIGIKSHNLYILEDISVSETYFLSRFAKAVITDTESLQDETTILQTPCITLLKLVARPETYTNGFNEVVGLDADQLSHAVNKLFNNEWKKAKVPYLWDGKAAYRIISALKNLS